MANMSYLNSIYSIKNLIILFVFVSSLFLSASSVVGSTNEKISFAWQPNPANENIVGYRLYYGKSSRFDSSGKQKTNFQYDYCVDFAELVRCSGNNFSNCEDLGPAQLNCENLYSETPKCTLTNLGGNKYFALTVYDNQQESAFTKELSKFGVTPASLVAQQAVFKLLLD